MKKQIRELVTTVHPYDLEGTIDNVILYLTELKAEFGEDCQLSWDAHAWECYEHRPTYYLYRMRNETAAEAKTRRAQQRAAAEATREQELKEFKRLKAKFVKE